MSDNSFQASILRYAVKQDALNLEWSIARPGSACKDTEFGKFERAPAYRLVYDAIEGQILSGRLRVGDPLPPEIQLAGQFGVNRSTVREGIRLLEQSGLVERDGGKRPRISSPHFLDLASSASRA